MLNNVTHRDLRVITRYGAQFGDEVGTVLTFPTEYADIQREYPIFFRKDPTSGEYHSVALLGFDEEREPVSGAGSLARRLCSGHRRARALPDRLSGARCRR
jgi:hypothetical protein